MSGLASKKEFLAITIRTYVKADIKNFWFCRISLDFLTFGSIVSLIVEVYYIKILNAEINVSLKAST